MITSFEKDINKKRSNSFKSDLKKYKIDKSQIIEYPKHLWFKGSRYR